MAVQLDSLIQAAVHALAGKIIGFFDSHNGTKGQLPVKLVDGGHALDPDEDTGADNRLYLVKKLGTYEHLHGYGIRKVADIKGQDELAAAQFPVLTGQHLTPKGHFPNLPVNLLNLHGLVFKVTSI